MGKSDGKKPKNKVYKILQIMEQYIPKSAVVAEIERRLKVLYKDRDFNYLQIKELEALLSSLNNLEVKEVDLWTELGNYIEHYRNRETGYSMFGVAKHFFELGLSVNNPITAADRGTAEEIIINLKRVEQDYHIDLTGEMEWVRNKVKKGEEI